MYIQSVIHCENAAAKDRLSRRLESTDSAAVMTRYTYYITTIILPVTL